MNKDFWERIGRLEELAVKAGDDEVIFYMPLDDNCEKQGAFINSASPATILEMIAVFKGRLSFLEHELVEKDIELENTKAELKRLEKEADWLAKMCRGFCDGHNYCNECVHYPRGCPIIKEIEYRFDKYEVEDWRKEARKAVSEDK